MRALAAVLAVVLLMSGVLSPCPACERAEAAPQTAAADTHACCKRQDAAEPGAAQPGSTSEEDFGERAPAQPGCDQLALSRMLAAMPEGEASPLLESNAADEGMASLALADGTGLGSAPRKLNVGRQGPHPPGFLKSIPGLVSAPLRL